MTIALVGLRLRPAARPASHPYAAGESAQTIVHGWNGSLIHAAYFIVWGSDESLAVEWTLAPTREKT